MLGGEGEGEGVVGGALFGGREGNGQLSPYAARTTCRLYILRTLLLQYPSILSTPGNYIQRSSTVPPNPSRAAASLVSMIALQALWLWVSIQVGQSFILHCGSDASHPDYRFPHVLRPSTFSPRTPRTLMHLQLTSLLDDLLTRSRAIGGRRWAFWSLHSSSPRPATTFSATQRLPD